MRLLLDTHIFLWSLLEPDRLTTRVAEELERANAELWLSSLSVWEIALLAERGRIRLDSPTEAWLETARKRCPVREAPVDDQIALASRTVPLAHQDPADRFIAATSVVRGFTLVTADQRLIDTPGLEVMPNR